MTNTEMHATCVNISILKCGNYCCIFLNSWKNGAATGANRSHVRREDVGDDLCTSNEAQVTCDPFRYLPLRSDWRASITHAPAVDRLWLNEPQHAQPVPIPLTADSAQHQQCTNVHNKWAQHLYLFALWRQHFKIQYIGSFTQKILNF